MDACSAAQEQGADLLYTTDLTQCLDEQLPQRLGIRGGEALVERLLGRGLIVAAVIDELATVFQAGSQFQPAAGACEIGVVLPQFPRPLVRNGPHLRHDGIDAADAGFDLDVSWHALLSQNRSLPPGGPLPSITEQPCLQGGTPCAAASRPPSELDAPRDVSR